MSKEKQHIKRYLISNTIMNIDKITNQIDAGYFADKELMVKLISGWLFLTVRYFKRRILHSI
jgi:hypothetical protein